MNSVAKHTNHDQRQKRIQQLHELGSVCRQPPQAKNKDVFFLHVEPFLKLGLGFKFVWTIFLDIGAPLYSKKFQKSQ